MYRKVPIIAIVLLLSVAVPVTFAYQGSKCKWSGHSGGNKLEHVVMLKAKMMLKNRDVLGLSEEQVEQISTLKRETKKNMIHRNADIDVLGVDIHALLREDAIDTAAVSGLMDQKYGMKAAKAKVLVAALAELKNTLSEKQMDALHDLWHQSSHDR